MEKSKQQVQEELSFGIPIKNISTYKVDLLWEDLLNVKGVLPTDKIKDIRWVAIEQTGWGFDEDQDNLLQPMITIIRPRLETDDEFYARMVSEEMRKREALEKERLLYLNLKAKFEREL